MDKQVCFSSSHFSFITIFITLLIAFLVYQIYNMSENFIKRFIESKREKIIITTAPSNNIENENKQFGHRKPNQQIVDNIYNPLIPPNRLYPGGRLNNTRQFDNYQMVGFVAPTADITQRYPLFGRYKYSGRSDRWEYYVIDESRNRIKIPITTKNDNELYDGDKQIISQLGGEFQVTLYKFNDFDYRDIQI